MKLKTVPTKTPGLLLALSILLAGGYALWQFGPKPNAVQSVQATTKPSPESPAQASTANNIGIAPFAPHALAGNRTAPTNSGNDQRPVTDYVQLLEKLYQEHGYQKVKYDPQQPEKPPSFPRGVMKFYWVSQTEEFTLISAFGVDANLQASAPAAQPETMVTLIKASERGTQWEAYRFTADQVGKQAASLPTNREQDYTGEDPPGIPKPTSLKRVLGFNAQGNQPGDLTAIYTSSESPASLGQWYRQQLQAAGWDFNAADTGGAQQVVDGTMCFSKGEQLCLVWIGSDEQCQCTSVIISTKRLTAAE